MVSLHIEGVFLAGPSALRVGKPSEVKLVPTQKIFKVSKHYEI